MSSGFVSGGTLDAPIERDDEWLAAQAAIESERRRKAELSAQNDGKSLFEVLQANKQAKQDAFEEAARLKNQYRALDEDEAGFLAEIMGKERMAEMEVKQDVEKEIEEFRRRREMAEKGEKEEGVEVEKVEGGWKNVGRKRKGPAEGLLKGVKIRRVDDEKKADDGANAKIKKGDVVEKKAAEVVKTSSTEKKEELAKPAAAPPPSKPTANALALGLGYGSSDEDD
ncbi:unnamed protein product [Periconia digitata]|uniref:FAM192A/Fyv6 N-terminal domain-containing protein n=1 Tax=Periconia digitata TaxID=1303443 RepID=A0A9W4U2F0_9PLEO|nr:unnamed protein product [Periconia digitata]